MGHRGVVITAGFDRSEAATCLVELFRQAEVPVVGIIVVTPFSFKRLSSFLKQHNFPSILKSFKRLFGISTSRADQKINFIEQFRDESNISISSLKKWAEVHKTKYLTVKGLNSNKTLRFLGQTKPQWLIYSGGGILKEPIIELLDGNILNAHQGPLPDTRGMNAAEWSILLDKKQEVTIHLINKGIDTGKIIKRISYSFDSNDDIESIRQKAIIKGVEGLVEVGLQESLKNFALQNNHSDYLQCYKLSDAMKELLKKKLEFIRVRRIRDQKN